MDQTINFAFITQKIHSALEKFTYCHTTEKPLRTIKLTEFGHHVNSLQKNNYLLFCSHYHLLSFYNSFENLFHNSFG